MLLGKTRQTIANTVSQPAKNATIFSLVSLTISVIALFLAITAVVSR